MRKNGYRFSKSIVSNKFVNDPLTNTQFNWRIDENPLIFGVTLPNFNNLIKYVNQNKIKIYESNPNHVILDQNYKGKSPDKEASSMQNLLNLYIEEEEKFKGYIVPNQTNP